MLLVVLYFTFNASVVAQSLSIICFAGQCLQGFTNTTIGATLSAPGIAASLLLLPGNYTSTTNPQLLHNLLTTSSATLSASPGFNTSSLSSLPVNIFLNPGLLIFSAPLYSGHAAFLPLPTDPTSNSSIPMSAAGLMLSNNLCATVSVDSKNDRVVLWDAIADISQLPFSSSASMSLLDLQSSLCSPACAGSGVCSTSGTCSCPSGFSGASCETCAQGFFGPSCQPCPANCTSCDQGISGSGLCLSPTVSSPPSSCNCLNGVCGSNGQCSCNAGWVTASNGTLCAQCAPGFFLTATGDCKICGFGCSKCTDTTGVCTACTQGFSQEESDNTKCHPIVSPGPVCGAELFLFGNSCVAANAQGICQGTNGMIADNNKKKCDSCGAKCISCQISNFTAASTTADPIQCTGCLPGFFLSQQGTCVTSCPSGTFVSDNTCLPCSSSCSTCGGSADFCLSCPSGQLLSSGQCISSCPSNTFSSSGSCFKCHPDCASCSGASFNQCSTCPPDRPVPAGGRCLSFCKKSQFFDTKSSSCLSCDSSCSSCSGSGPNSCLACSSSTQILVAGSCVSANCNGTSNVIPGLGMCLSELVILPTESHLAQPSTTGSLPSLTGLPQPSLTGLSEPTVTKIPLAWWQILLMGLGCAFILFVIVMLLRRQVKKQRAKRTKEFADAKERLMILNAAGANGKGKRSKAEVLPITYNRKHRRSIIEESIIESRPPSIASSIIESRPPSIASIMESRPPSITSSHKRRQDIKMKKIGAPNDRLKKKFTEDDWDDFIDAYDYSTYSRSSWAPTTLVDFGDNARKGYSQRRVERDSIYSQVTGKQRHTPEPRQPLRKEPGKASRFPRSARNGRKGVLVGIEEEESRTRTPPLPPHVAKYYKITPADARAYMKANEDWELE